MKSSKLNLKIFGLGGAGINIISEFAGKSLISDELIILDSDLKAINNINSVNSFLVGNSICHGLGCGGEDDLAVKAAESFKEKIKELVKDTEIIIFVVGVGGGIGSALAKVIAETASQFNIFSLGFCILPFSFEGSRYSKGERQLGNLRPYLNGLFAMPNDYLLQEENDDNSALKGFNIGNNWIINCIQSLSDLLFNKGILNLDFGTLKNVFQNSGGKASFSSSQADMLNCQNTEIDSFLKSVLLHPLLHSEDRAKKIDGLIILIRSRSNIALDSINKIASVISKEFKFNEEINIDAYVDESLKNELSIVILTKSEIDGNQKCIPQNKEISKDIDSISTRELSDLEILDKKSFKPKKLTLHKSKLGKKFSNKSNSETQKEFMFFDKDINRGYFTDVGKSLFRGVNLDQPTYLRKGIKIKHKC